MLATLRKLLSEDLGPFAFASPQAEFAEVYSEVLDLRHARPTLAGDAAEGRQERTVRARQWPWRLQQLLVRPL